MSLWDTAWSSSSEPAAIASLFSAVLNKWR